MLTRIDLRYFKCFESLQMPLASLTLLSGSNASGKSSVLQALVLLHQTIVEHEWSNRLMLNGDVIRLGTVADVVDELHGRQQFDIGIEFDEQRYVWSFKGERAEMSVSVEAVRTPGGKADSPEVLHHLLPTDEQENARALIQCLQRLTYITAERIGPREVYELEDRRAATVVGPCGEHAVSVLHWGRDERVRPELRIDETAPTRLHQVQARMRQFFPGCSLILEQVPRTNSATLGLRSSDDSEFHRPVNVGFGLTQVLPIVIAGLSANAGDVVLVENPEVHLHPAGQKQMGQFLSELAQSGVQVLVETHSDHVLNGIRLAVKRGADAETIKLHYFRQRSDQGSQVTSPLLDATGGIDAWPDGFFDQFDKDAMDLAGWSD